MKRIFYYHNYKHNQHLSLVNETENTTHDIVMKENIQMFNVPFCYFSYVSCDYLLKICKICESCKLYDI